MIIDGRPEGSDLTLINTLYHYPRKDANTGKWSKDQLDIIYRDNVTGEKFLEQKEEPGYEFYVAKDGVDISYNHLYLTKDQVTRHEVPYRNLDKSIAEITDNLPFYYENLKLGNRGANRKLHLDPRILNSDSNIEEHYRKRFTKEYGNKLIPVSKSYFDIEADTINMEGDFPQPGECPVNAVTIIMEHLNKTYTLLLRNKNNPLIEEFEKSINNDLFVELKTFIQEKVGGWKNEIRFGLDKMDYQFIFYDEEDEINLIGDLFRLINTAKPDFVLAWNMAFDMPYIMQRIINLGYNPEDVICHPDFNRKVCRYYIDEKAINDLAERGDRATVSSYSVYLDQMIHFASRRKGQSAFHRFNLDYIGEAVAHVRKLDYSHITTNIAKFPYLDYKLFVFYNIMDTIVQKCVERKTGDIDYVFSKCLFNNTRYYKCHRQTVYLTNRGNNEFDKDEFIMGNNFNFNNEKPKEKFPGAFVAEPFKLNAYSKRKRFGQPINVFDNGDDFDYKSLYPSAMREMNMAPHTQIGLVCIPEQIRENENPFNNKYFTRGGYFIEDLHSGVYLEFAHRWLNLPTFGELVDQMDEYFKTKYIPSNPLELTRNGMILPVTFYETNIKREAVHFDTNRKGINPITFVNEMPDTSRVYAGISKEVIYFDESFVKPN